MASPHPFSPPDIRAADLLREITSLRDQVAVHAGENQADFAGLAGREAAGLDNLADYLAFRRNDIRPLQRRLMALGVSSLGRAEGRILPAFDAVIAALAGLAGQAAPRPTPDEAEFFSGEMRLAAAADALFGPPSGQRRGRIMVTLSTEAAEDPEYAADLVRAGMDVARINCAHDDAEAWASMADHVRHAGRAQDRDIKILMDIAGPKIRTDAVHPRKGPKLERGDRFELRDNPGSKKNPGGKSAWATVAPPGIVGRLERGQRMLYDDGKIAGMIEHIDHDAATVRVTHSRTDGARLKPEKGLNFPDTTLQLQPLTDKDKTDLEAVVRCADMIGYSFVTAPEDIDRLEAALEPYGDAGRRLALVLKIEQPAAVANLPQLIARGLRHRALSVMIARGDLAAEIGFERVAEMQEEMLWLCEAASIPAIWATQVLEGMVKDGTATRGEMTDAAMAARAECVMLNKGPNVVEAIATLDRLIARMDAHVFKKTALLRSLHSW